MNEGKERMKTQKVIVYSDYVCPFCFIGKNRADRLRRDLNVKIDWRGIEIHPEYPPEGIPSDRLNRSYMERAWTFVRALAKEDGLLIREPKKVSNTRTSLRLAEYAKDNGKFQAYHDEMFKAYFQEQKDINDIPTLKAICKKAGLNPDEAEKIIESNAYDDRIRAHEMEASTLGITGVPTFVIGDQILVGAQHYNVLRDTVRNQAGNGGKTKKFTELIQIGKIDPH